MNMAVSADGKISTFAQGKVRFGSPKDRLRLEQIRSAADAVVVGHGKLLQEDPPILLRLPEMRAAYEAARGRPHPINLAVCSRLDFEPAGRVFFTHSETRRLVVTTPRTTAEERARFEPFAEIMVVPADDEGRVDLRAMAAGLMARGITRLAFEGGAELNFAMIAAGLVDELFLTVCPFVFGGASALTAVDGPGFTKEQVRRLALVEVDRGDAGEVFLHYRVSDRPIEVTRSAVFQGGHVMK